MLLKFRLFFGLDMQKSNALKKTMPCGYFLKVTQKLQVFKKSNTQRAVFGFLITYIFFNNIWKKLQGIVFFFMHQNFTYFQPPAIDEDQQTKY